MKNVLPIVKIKISTLFLDFKKRHRQMAGWVKQRMIPVFQDGRCTPESHGVLRSVWLGGLVNPTALLMAMRQEKAVLAGCMVDQVREDLKSIFALFSIQNTHS